MSDSYKKVTKAPAPVHTAAGCQAPREVLSLIGDKWSMLIVVMLKGGTRRFNELRHSIEGISQRMLTRTLRSLERDGLVSRRVEPTVPPSVYYELTDLGHLLLIPVSAVTDWAQTHYAEVLAAREKFDKANPQKATA